MDIVRALDDLGGAARRAELLSAGVSERSLRRSVLDGRIERLGHGTYVLPWVAPEQAIAKRFRQALAA